MNYPLLIGLLLFTGFIFGNLFYHKSKSDDRLGSFPINKNVFISGKLTMGINWGIIFLQAAGIQIYTQPQIASLTFISTIMVYAGFIFVALAFLKLGRDSRFGISDETKELRTTGVYRISRNPMYVGFFLVSLASILIVPNILNIICGLAGIYIHHLIAISEETFLEKQYGDLYEQYKRSVRRYF